MVHGTHPTNLCEVSPLCHVERSVAQSRHLAAGAGYVSFAGRSLGYARDDGRGDSSGARDDKKTVHSMFGTARGMAIRRWRWREGGAIRRSECHCDVRFDAWHETRKAHSTSLMGDSSACVRKDLRDASPLLSCRAKRSVVETPGCGRGVRLVRSQIPRLRSG